MRLSTVILPLERWPDSKQKWCRAEELGFFAAYTYDHLSWGRLQDRPWFGTIPTLAAASQVTSTLRLGTLVTSPNFRHPVPLAKDLMSLDDLANGRLIVGVGSGGVGNDATVLGEGPWSPSERTERFIEFVDLLDVLLRQVLTTRHGEFYSASEARMVPGTLQRPRPPFAIAASGRRSYELAARLGKAWVSTGVAAARDLACFDVVQRQIQDLSDACLDAGRHVNDLEKILLDGLNDEKPLRSLDAFVDWAGRYQELGITELVIHWPEPASLFDVDTKTFERIASDGLAQLGSRR